MKELFASEIGIESKKNEPLVTVDIDMARHSLKTKTPDGREPITAQGMKEAAAAGETSAVGEMIRAKAEAGEDIEVWCSPRERTKQSSLVRAFGKQFKDANFEGVDPQDVVRWLEDGGVKTKQSPLLDFQMGEGRYTDEMMEIYSKGKDGYKPGALFKWMADNSDLLALESKQNPEKVSPLSIQAGNIAGFIWALGSQKANQIIKEHKNKIDAFFATSHQTVLESFLYKAILIVEGKESADKFAAANDGKGFKENQGFQIKYEQYSQNPLDFAVIINYQGQKYKLESKDIGTIMQEGVDLKAQLAENLEKN